MWLQILKLLLPYMLDALKSYIASTDTKKDDVILDIAKETSKYMSEQDNNNLSRGSIQDILTSKMDEDYDYE